MRLLSTSLAILTMITSLSVCEAPQLYAEAINTPAYGVMEIQTNKVANPLPPTSVNYKNGSLTWRLPTNNKYTGFEIQVEYKNSNGRKTIKTKKAAKSQVKCTIESLGLNKLSGISIRTYYNVPSTNGSKVLYSKWIAAKMN